MIITGQIDPKQVFETVKPFEDKIVSKVSKLFHFSVFFTSSVQGSSVNVLSSEYLTWLKRSCLVHVLAVYNYLAEK